MAHKRTSPFQHECRIRDFFAAQLGTVRPAERVVAREYHYPGTRARADLRTVDDGQVLREWEFKLCADYRALGQVLVYTAMARREVDFTRAVRGVIAAFEFPADLRAAVEVMNLNIELVTLPPWMARAGAVPCSPAPQLSIPNIPTKQRPANDRG